jgi:Flp pilus assembly protein TadG
MANLAHLRDLGVRGVIASDRSQVQPETGAADSKAGGPDMRVFRRQDRRGEAGAGLVEMAIVVPLLFLLVFGILDFGVFLYRNIELTQGVREAGRQGAVALYNGGNAACNRATPTDTLVCLTKQRSGVAGMKVYVLVPSNTVGSPFAVCATYQSSAVTGLIQPFLPKYMHTETIMRLEQAPPPPNGLITGGDTDPEGNSWASCKAPT